MPIYTYRREDGTTFDYRQKFMDEPLTVDPETGQQVVRVIQSVGVIFKGSGFYINDSKSASRTAVTTTPKSDKNEKSEKSDSDNGSKSEKSNGSSESKSESKTESKSSSSSSESSTPAATPAKTTAAAD